MVNEDTGGPFIIRRAKSAHSETCEKNLSKLSNKHNLRSTKSHKEFYATRAQKSPDVKFARPQSVLPMERSMFYYTENATGFIKPQKVLPDPKSSLLTNRSSNSLVSSCKPIKRSSLLPFSKITVLKLNAPNFNSNFKTQSVKETLVVDSPSVTFGRPVSKASSKLPIFCRSQQSNSRPQSSFAKYYNVNSPTPMSVSQYRNYLLDLHERGIGRNPDSSAMLNWVNLERNEGSGTVEVDNPQEGERRVNKVGFKTSRSGYVDGSNLESLGPNKTRRNFKVTTTNNGNTVSYRDTMKAVKKCSSWIDQNIEYLTPTATPRPQSSNLLTPPSVLIAQQRSRGQLKQQQQQPTSNRLSRPPINIPVAI